MRPYWFAAAIMLAVLGGCRTETVPEPGGTPAGNICVSIADWYGRYQDELPFMSMPPGSGHTRLGVGNLYRASAFTSVFGAPYAEEYRIALRQKYIDAVVPCYQERRLAVLMKKMRPLLDMTLDRFDPELADHAARLDERALWVKAAIAEIGKIPATEEGLARLEQFRSERESIAWLWPSEKAAFDIKLEERQRYVMKSLPARAAPVVQTPEARSRADGGRVREADAVRDRRPLWQRLGEKGKWAIEKINDGLSRLGEDIFRDK